MRTRAGGVPWRRSTRCLAHLGIASCLVAPSARAQQPQPAPGERIRVAMAAGVAGRLGIPSEWEGTFIMFRHQVLVANNPYFGAVALPLNRVDAVHVQRRRSPAYGITKAAVVGAVFGVGMWQFLRILCRSACGSSYGGAWLPATVTGLGVGVLVGFQGPGTHWVPAALPAAGLPPNPAGRRR